MIDDWDDDIFNLFATDIANYIVVCDLCGIKGHVFAKLLQYCVHYC